MRKPLSREAQELLKLLGPNARPKPAPCSAEIRNWWELQALPLLKDQALSQLRRKDQMDPALIGFMDDGTMGIIDVEKATGGFGDQRSKNATAAVQQLAACIPGTKASVFVVEAWGLRANKEGELDRQLEKYPNLGDHPDRYEIVMFNMLHRDPATNTMMQLQTMIEVIKVLGAKRSRAAWNDTKFGRSTTDDPMGDGELSVKGRFIFADDGKDDT